MRILWIDTNDNPWLEQGGWDTLVASGVNVARVDSYESAKQEIDHNTFDLFVVAVEVPNALRLVDEIKCHAQLWRVPCIIISSTWVETEFKNHAAQPTAAEQYANVPISVPQFIQVLQQIGFTEISHKRPSGISTSTENDAEAADQLEIGPITYSASDSIDKTMEHEEREIPGLQFNLSDDNDGPEVQDEASRLINAGAAAGVTPPDATAEGQVMSGLPAGDFVPDEGTILDLGGLRPQTGEEFQIDQSGRPGDAILTDEPLPAQEGQIQPPTDVSDLVFNVDGGPPMAGDIGMSDDEQSLQFDNSPFAAIPESGQEGASDAETVDDSELQFGAANEGPADTGQMNQDIQQALDQQQQAARNVAPEELLVATPVPPVSPATAQGEQTVRDYLHLREQELAQVLTEKKALDQTVINLQQEVRELKALNRKIEDELEAERNRAGNLEKEMAKMHHGMEQEREKLAFQKQMSDDRADDLERNLNTFREKHDALRKRVRKDIQQISQRERELEAKLELSRKDAEAIIKARDEEVIALKRKIDALEFDLDQVQDSRIQAKAEADRYIDKLINISRTLNVALGMIDSGNKEENEFEAAEPQVGGAAAADFPEPAAAESQPAGDQGATNVAGGDETEATLLEGDDMQSGDGDFMVDDIQPSGDLGGMDDMNNEMDQFESGDDSDFALG